MMDIKLVAMDLDGTLLDSAKSVSELNIKALRACEARGVLTVLASGRAFESMHLLMRYVLEEKT